LPALIFSSIVTAFTHENISAFGSLAMVAILYQILGLSLAWIVREVLYVPMDFQWGILVVCPF
jgi:predicted permease